MAGHGRFFVGGNWKCNGTVDSVSQLVKDLNAGSIPPEVDVVISPTFVHLETVKQTIKGPYEIAAQNCWTGKGGAFTGEISAEMLKDMDIPWVILGHSERRSLCGESCDVVGTKIRYALDQGLKVIACIGETLEERESGDMFNVLDQQLVPIQNAVDDWANVVIAYEPVWAIGTGVVATPDQAEEAHAFVRKWLEEHIGQENAANLRILYGGSVNDGNCVELSKKPNVDGFLVGGASLKGDTFVTICNATKTAATA
jgi:triosephosphate isomerase